jgi:Right handed beta helix region/Bacterial pre-peptidase C-terminal domain
MLANGGSMGRMIWIAAFIVILCAGFTDSAVALDSFEPNDDAGEAYGLTNGAQIESWISASDDTDWYTFLCSRAGYLNIMLTSLPTNYDLDFYWYDPDEEGLILLVRSDNGGMTDEQISGTLSGAGRFYIHVYGVGGAYDSQESYLLQTTWPGDEPNVNLTTPNGGQVWHTATSQTIQYTATDLDSPDEALLIKLEYSTDDGGSWTVIDSALVNTGSYSWTVPYVSSTAARVQISAHDGYTSDSDYSLANFTIYGDTHEVEADGSGDFATIQQAVDGAFGGDTIELGDGTYTGFRNRDVDVGGKWLTIRSASDNPVACVIDCNGTYSDPHRGFIYQSNDGAWAVLQGISVVDGYADWSDDKGGGVYCKDGAAPTITNCILTNNHAQKGGGIYSDAAVQSISSCVFNSNSARDGGGVYLYNSYAVFSDCSWLENTADLSGAALYCYQSSPELTDCLMSENVADGNGGAIINWISSSPILDNCTLYGNGAAGYGGGISSWHNSAPVLENTIITGGSAGEAVHCDGSSSAALSCSDLFDNDGGDWIGCISDQADSDGNMALDPQLCDPAGDDWHLSASSPCAPDNNLLCGLVGLFDVGCGATGDENVVVNPDTLSLTTSAPSATQVIHYEGGGSAPVFGYEIDVEWDHTVVSAVFAKPDSGDFAGAAFFSASTVADGHTKIVATLTGGEPGSLGPEDLFKATWTALVTDDETAIDLSLIEMRDNENNTLSGFLENDGLVTVLVGPQISNVAITNETMPTDDYIKNGDAAEVTAQVTGIGALNIIADLTSLGGLVAATPDSYVAPLATWTIASVTATPADGGLSVLVSAWDAALTPGIPLADTIIADNTKPDAMTGLTALPGHQQVSLTWDDASTKDLYYSGVMIRAAAWGDYPEYDDAEPSYPANQAAGSEAYSGAGVSGTHSFGAPSRDIYYYRGFVYDIAGNYALTGATARSTNYWLGDVVPDGAWNGLVNTADISLLGAQFLLDPLTNEQVDIGPTHDGSRTGIPVPDGEADLEDAMIFSLNFGVVGLQQPHTPPVAATDGIAIHLILDDYAAAAQPGDELTALVVLQDPEAAVKGVSFKVAIDSAESALVSVERRGLSLGGQVLFMQREASVSAVALGANTVLGGSGELAILRIRQLGEKRSDLALIELHARDVHNRELLAEASAAGDRFERIIPSTLYLLPNRPNPVIHTTRLCFGLPTAKSTRIEIFDISGRLVRRLVNEELPAGEYALEWDRRDERGDPVTGGVYLYLLRTPGKSISRKMVIR